MRSLRVSNIDERLVTRCGRLPDPLAVYSRSRRKRRKPDRGCSSSLTAQAFQEREVVARSRMLVALVSRRKRTSVAHRDESLRDDKNLEISVSLGQEIHREFVHRQ
jgi:hypothetical protein